MHKSVQKLFYYLSLSALCLSLGAAQLNTLNAVPVECSITSDSESGITPYADVIVYKTRMHNGVAQYRRWNETRGYWVDPDWIDVPG